MRAVCMALLQHCPHLPFKSLSSGLKHTFHNSLIQAHCVCCQLVHVAAKKAEKHFKKTKITKRNPIEILSFKFFI